MTDDKTLLIPGCSEHVCRRDYRLIGELGQMRCTLLSVTFRRIKTSANRSRAHIDRVKIFLGIAQELDFAVERCSESVKLLAKRHRHSWRCCVTN